MAFLADLHIHSRFSIATAKTADLEHYAQWARIKGITVLGTGDFTHPGWMSEIEEKLQPLDNGLFRIKAKPLPDPFPDCSPPAGEVYFCLSAEISSIYKKGDKTRKVHSLIFAPDLESARRIRVRLERIGNIGSDGRPILGLPPRDLLEICLEASPRACLIPAHVWTPWFSLFGSKSGFDCIEDCFEDLTDQIFALETGLSSDPEMNRRWSALDGYTLISNSDAHSPPKLGREATCFDDCPLSYDGIFAALRSGSGLQRTYEFFPQEGKYHYDGHRKCGICLDPEETRQLEGICPVCAKPLTVGVLHRVQELSDRRQGEQRSCPFAYLIPLPELIGELLGKNAASKAVQARYAALISEYGPEFRLAFQLPLESLRRNDPLLAEALQRMRRGLIVPQPGFDGQFGNIRVFKAGELEQLRGQQTLFALGDSLPQRVPGSAPHSAAIVELAADSPSSDLLNPEQREVLNLPDKVILVRAGPGTGKTRLLIHWVAHQVHSGRAAPEQILVVTFTNKAARELQIRLGRLLSDRVDRVIARTFHGLCFDLLKSRDPELEHIVDDRERIKVLSLLYPDLKAGEVRQIARVIEDKLADAGIPEIDGYLDYLKRSRSADLSRLVIDGVNLLSEDGLFRRQVQEQFKAIAVDELQDINPVQYRLLQHLAPEARLLAIGDPDQAIYGFRGGEAGLFDRLAVEFSARVVTLTRNYRSVAPILTAAQALLPEPFLETQRESDDPIQIVSCDTVQQEAREVVSVVEYLVGGTSPLSIHDQPGAEYGFSDIAVLYRIHRLGAALLPYLQRAGIPVTMSSDISLFAEPPFSTLKSIVSLLAGQPSAVALQEVLTQAAPQSPPALIRALVLEQWTDGAPTTEQVLDLKWLGRLPGDEPLETYFSILRELKTGLTDMPGTIRVIADKLLRLDMGDPELNLKVDQIAAFAEPFDPAGFLARIALSRFESEDDLRAEKVRLLTFHAAKGLEFPAVVIVGAEEGIVPLQASDLEEERRLFYVALTRARDHLQISHSARRREYGREVVRPPSRFLHELPPEVVRERRSLIERKNDQLTLFEA